MTYNFIEREKKKILKHILVAEIMVQHDKYRKRGIGRKTQKHYHG